MTCGYPRAFRQHLFVEGSAPSLYPQGCIERLFAGFVAYSEDLPHHQFDAGEEHAQVDDGVAVGRERKAYEWGELLHVHHVVLARNGVLFVVRHRSRSGCRCPGGRGGEPSPA